MEEERISVEIVSKMSTVIKNSGANVIKLFTAVIYKFS
jgi:hypothetical protein